MDLQRRIGGPKLLAALLGGFTLLFLLCAGLVLPFEVLYRLAAGWVNYLGRVVPQLRPDPWVVATALVCLAGVSFGTHRFARWVYAATSPEPRRWRRKWTALLVGLFVLAFAAGTAFTGMAHQTAWLVRSPEPLVSDRRAAAVARIRSTNNLKQIGLAAHNYHDDRAAELPRSRFDAAGRPTHSWQAALLPYLEEEPLYRTIDFTKPWTDPANAQPMAARVKPFLNPSFDADTVGDRAASHYAGNVAVVLSDVPRRLADFPAGLSNTILAGEVSGGFRAWGDPLNARDPRLGVAGHPHGFGGPRGRPARFVMADATTRTFDPQELAALVGKVPE
ncbi:MAG: hypothetical protein C0501_06400 [Isosphaera sp.]|nr:hypothetical protein [Isosphaera sp.]